MLKIFDSLTKEKREFKPIKPGHIGIYVCGNTVYDHCHIGHGRAMVLFDAITRYLRSRGWQVTYVRNITDIDDKIIKRAALNGETCDQLTARYIAAQRNDEIALGIVPPDSEPKATDYVPHIIELIKKIIDRGHAYVTANGDVYFDVRSFPEYGKLSHRNVDDLRAGVRIELGETKKDPLDFALWKTAKPGEPTWDSPWGAGRPGWHIECSAMTTSVLGQPFDIHGGGLDLKFPHHENEIAQSESVCHEGFAHYWMHVGLLQINKEKMSKSLGNFVTIQEALVAHHPEVIRYFMLSSHYRSPVNYSDDNLTQMRQALIRLYAALDGLPEVAPEWNHYQDQFNAAMDDDFNTPEALAVLFEMAREINRIKEGGDEAKAAALAMGLKQLAHPFGLLQSDPAVFLTGDTADLDTDQIEQLIEQRQQERLAKNWAGADAIRDKLWNLGVELLDTKDGIKWRSLKG